MSVREYRILVVWHILFSCTFAEKEKELSLRTVNVIRYIVPLREGGSLPALAEADDGFKYVLKFRGSGHGTKRHRKKLNPAQNAAPCWGSRQFRASRGR